VDDGQGSQIDQHCQELAWQTDHTDRKEYGPFAIAQNKEYGRKSPRDAAIRKVNKDFGKTISKIVLSPVCWRAAGVGLSGWP